MRHQLTWTHYKTLLLKDINEINYYIDISIKQNLSYRELREKIKNEEYERLDDKTIGIIIVRKENKFIMEYCSDERILSRVYEIV